MRATTTKFRALGVALVLICSVIGGTALVTETVAGDQPDVDIEYDENSVGAVGKDNRYYAEQLIVTTRNGSAFTLNESTDLAFRIHNEDTQTSVTAIPETGGNEYSVTGVKFDLYEGDGTISEAPELALELDNGTDVRVGAIIEGEEETFTSGSSPFANYTVELLDKTPDGNTSVIATTEPQLHGIGYPGTLTQNSTTGTIEITLDRNESVDSSWHVVYNVENESRQLLETEVSNDENEEQFSVSIVASTLDGGNYTHAMALYEDETASFGERILTVFGVEGGPSGLTITSSENDDTIVVDATGPSDYDTIQAAVDNANSGDTIKVRSGTYRESVFVDKSVEIIGVPDENVLGPGAGAPVLDGERETKDTFVLARDVSDVTIAGFEIREYGDTSVDNVTSQDARGSGIAAWNVSASNITIRDNYIHTLGWNGILFGGEGYVPHENITIARNKIEDVAFYGVSFGNIHHGTVVNNSIEAGLDMPDTLWYVEGNNTDGGIAVWALSRRDSITTRDVVVRNNTISGPFDLAAVEHFVNDFRNQGAPADVSAASENITISHNQLSGSIGVRYLIISENTDASDVLVEQNSISDGREGVRIDTSQGAMSQPITIRHNEIDNNTHGVVVGEGTDADPVGVTENLITNNDQFGALNDGLGTLNASYNYWGASDGPSGVFAGSGDAVSDGVLVNPFYTDADLTALDSTGDSDTGTPTADAGSDQVVDENTSIQLNATGSSDPDGDDLSYTWTQTAGPSVTLSNTTSPSPTFTAPDVSEQTTLIFEVEVSDGQTTDTDTVNVTVRPVLDPIAGLDPPTDPDGDGKFEDVNGDGGVNVGDVQALFANSRDPVVQNNVAAFDFNGDGAVNVGDVQALFAKGVAA